jgi:hypothetical protein
MKKTILTLAVLGALSVPAFSQGLVYFTGGASNATKISTNSAVGGVATGRTAGDNTYYYALFASSSQTSIGGNSAAFSGNAGTYVFNATGWTLVGIAGNSQTLNGVGTFVASSQGSTSAGQGALNTDGSLSVSGIAGAAAGNFVVVGWSANIGSTLAALEAWYNNPLGIQSQGWIGQSRIGIGQTLGDNGQNATLNVMGTATTSINAFTMGEVPVVPEPGTLALAALGGASLLLFRRKK